MWKARIGARVGDGISFKVYNVATIVETTSQPTVSCAQCLVKGENFFAEILTFIFDMERVLLIEEYTTSTASQLTSPASQKSKDSKKVLLLLQDLACTSRSRHNVSHIYMFDN